jgi:hypothetical protein
MKRSCLILSNSNLFSVLSLKGFQPYYYCNERNLRFSNENMNKDEFLFQQIEDLYKDYYYKKGLLFSKSDFAFNNHLLYRIKTCITMNNPGLIFLELQSLKDIEWSLLSFLAQTKIPILLFVPPEKNNERLAFELMNYGVKEIISEYDILLFEELARRHKKTHY